MKKLLLLSLITFIALESSAQKLQAFFNYCQFNTPMNTPYIETYLGVAGKSVKYIKNANNKFQGTVDVTLIFRKDSTIMDFKKININSPEINDTTNIDFAIIDLQRFSLPNGTYAFDILISDHNKSKNSFKSTEKIVVNFDANKVYVSDIELLESIEKSEKQNLYSKNGYNLKPFISDFYNSKINKLKFYCEIYNTDKIIGKDKSFILKYYIKSFETGKTITDLARTKKQQSSPVTVCLSELPIDKLPSGNYNLCLDVIDETNTIISSKSTFFQRSNPNFKMDSTYINNIVATNTFASAITNRDTLVSYIRSLIPIASYQESYFIANQLKQSSLEILQKFFYYFWKERSDKPETLWAQYNLEVQKVNRSYGTQIKRGCETDRGRVYLQYGPPNTISKSENEPYNFPYEIWHYYTIKRQSNRKFIFYSPELTNDYVLLHSDAIGEIYDPYWQKKLKIRNTADTNVDDKGDTEDNWGDKAKELFQNPH